MSTILTISPVQVTTDKLMNGKWQLTLLEWALKGELYEKRNGAYYQLVAEPNGFSFGLNVWGSLKDANVSLYSLDLYVIENK